MIGFVEPRVLTHLKLVVVSVPRGCGEPGEDDQRRAGYDQKWG